MSRLIARVLLVAVVTAVALTRLHSEQELLAWELLLLGVVIWEMRAIPAGPLLEDPPLFILSPRDPPRLPRPVSSAELSVIDALAGHLGPDRRLQPTLMRIAFHRLQKEGIAFDSAAAAEVLGKREWAWLANPTDRAPDAETVERVVSSLEDA